MGGGKDKWLSCFFGWQTLCQKQCIQVNGPPQLQLCVMPVIAVWWCCRAPPRLNRLPFVDRFVAMLAIYLNIAKAKHNQKVKWSNLLFFFFFSHCIPLKSFYFISHPLCSASVTMSKENNKNLTRVLILPYCIQNKIVFWF